MTDMYGRTNRATTPDIKQRLATLDDLGAPYFHGLPCPACGAESNEFCTNPGRGLFAHQQRVDAAFHVAYGKKQENQA